MKYSPDVFSIEFNEMDQYANEFWRDSEHAGTLIDEDVLKQMVIQDATYPKEHGYIKTFIQQGGRSKEHEELNTFSMDIGDGFEANRDCYERIIKENGLNINIDELEKLSKGEIAMDQVVEKEKTMEQNQSQQKSFGEIKKEGQKNFNEAFYSKENMEAFVTRTADYPLHFDARAVAQLDATNLKNHATLGTADMMNSRYIPIKGQKAVASVNKPDGNIEPVFDVSKTMRGETREEQKQERAKALGRLFGNSPQSSKLDYDKKNQALTDWYDKNHRSFKPTGEHAHDTQVAKNIMSGYIARKQLGLLKKDSPLKFPEGLNFNPLLDVMRTPAERNKFMGDVRRQARMITRDVVRQVTPQPKITKKGPQPEKAR